MYGLLILIFAGLAFAFLLMAGMRLSSAFLACGLGTVAAFAVMVATVDRGPNARWAAIQHEAYETAWRDRNAGTVCAGFLERNILSRHLGKDRWCGAWLDRRERAERYEASMPCRRDLGARRAELAAIPGATEVVDGKRYIVDDYSDSICGSR